MNLCQYGIQIKINTTQNQD